MSVLIALPLLFVVRVCVPPLCQDDQKVFCGSAETQCNRVLRSAVPRASEREWGLGSAASSKTKLDLGVFSGAGENGDSHLQMEFSEAPGAASGRTTRDSWRRQGVEPSC